MIDVKITTSTMAEYSSGGIRVLSKTLAWMIISIAISARGIMLTPSNSALSGLIGLTPVVLRRLIYPQ